MRLIIVSNRLPVTVIRQEQNFISVPSTGGLVSGLNAFLNPARNPDIKNVPVKWIGWPGIQVDAHEEAMVSTLMEEQQYVPVFLDDALITNYYMGFCNATVWPVFHGFPECMQYKDDYSGAYYKAQQQYFKVLKKEIRAGDIVWIHDFHLMSLPALLRKQYPQMHIGFFLHIPFPGADVFKFLPPDVASEMMRSVLRADVIGFNATRYTDNFITLQRHLNDGKEIAAFTGALIATFPIGVDTGFFAGLSERLQFLPSAGLANRKIILAVSRLDFIKGIPNQLRAFRQLLQKYPQWRGNVTLRLWVVPSREALLQNIALKEEIEALVTGICNSYQHNDWLPVAYTYGTCSPQELVAGYLDADVAMVAPLIDGMNLIAKEYVACRQNDTGVLVLSKQAGASDQLTDALLVDAYDVNDICNKLKMALEMDVASQRKRMATLRNTLEAYDIFHWGNFFIAQTIRQRTFAKVC